MGTGPCGQTGASALSHVEVDFILVQEPAVILLQAMVGRVVRENQIRFALAAHNPVQVTVCNKCLLSDVLTDSFSGASFVKWH